MKNKLIFLSVAIIIILSVIMAIRYFSPMSGQAAGDASMSVTAYGGTVENLVTAQGTLEPRDSVDVGAQVSGLVETMHFEEGNKVTKGDLIAEIDPELYESTVRGDQAQIKRLEAQKAEQEATIKQAQNTYDRNVKLIEKKAVSSEELEDSETTLAIAKAQLLSIEAQLEESQSTLEGDITNLGYTKIYAPIDGTIVSQEVEQGQTINANQTTPTIVTVADLDTMTVRAEVAEADIMKITQGMDMYFTTLGSSERKWEGTVREILPSPVTENDVVLYNVLIDVDNKDRQLMTGMTAQIFFVQDKAENVVIIPLTALHDPVKDEDKDGYKAYTVMVQGQTGKPEKRTILTSISNRTHIAVVSGLQDGEKVLMKPSGTTAETGKSSNTPRPPMGGL